ncbi:MAG: aspartate/glutamate racemase family protein [Actinomycetota bacterium]|nr:aspartate/glutamate racemase family protein [Actinomycetota bacterium]
MRRVGLLGGMSWQSSLHYYRLLNEMVQQRVGGHASAPLVLWSADFAEIEALQQAGDWTAAGEILATAAQGLQRCGVQAIALATNTMHVVADEISDRIDVGFIDLVDVVGKAVTDAGLRTVGLLGTGYLMASDLYPARLGALGVDVLLPEEPDRADVHRVIFDELVHGVLSAAARNTYLAIIDRLVSRGAEAVVLACTEIGLLLTDGDAAVPLLDSTLLHCAALSDFIVGGTHDSGALA